MMVYGMNEVPVLDLKSKPIFIKLTGSMFLW